MVYHRSSRSPDNRRYRAAPYPPRLRGRGRGRGRGAPRGYSESLRVYVKRDDSREPSRNGYTAGDFSKQIREFERPFSRERIDSRDFDRPESSRREESSRDFDRAFSRKREDSSKDFDRPASRSRREDSSRHFDRPESSRREESGRDFDRPESSRREGSATEFDRAFSRKRETTAKDFDRPESSRREDSGRVFDRAGSIKKEDTKMYDSSTGSSAYTSIRDPRMESVSPTASDEMDEQNHENILKQVMNKHNSELKCTNEPYWEDAERSFTQGCSAFYRASYKKVEADFKEDFRILIQEREMLKSQNIMLQQRVQGMEMNDKEEVDKLREQYAAMESKLRFVESEKNVFESDAMELKKMNKELQDRVRKLLENAVKDNEAMKDQCEEMKKMEDAYVKENEEKQAEYKLKIEELEKTIADLKAAKR